MGFGRAIRLGLRYCDSAAVPPGRAGCRRPRQQAPAVAADKWPDYPKRKGSCLLYAREKKAAGNDGPGNHLPETRYRGAVRKAGILLLRRRRAVRCVCVCV